MAMRAIAHVHTHTHARTHTHTHTQVLMATRAIAHRKIVALQRTKLAMELLGGTASVPKIVQMELSAQIRAEEASVGVLGPESADAGASHKGAGAGARGDRGGAEASSSLDAGSMPQSPMTGGQQEEDGFGMGAEDGGKTEGKKKVVADVLDRPVTDVLTSDLEIIACFKNTGWDPALRGGKGEWTTSTPNWHTAAGNLIHLRGVLSREAERKRRPMVLSTGSPQTCVAVSDKFKVILAGGKDRIIRVWNPLIQLENVGVDTLKGHDARIIGLIVIDKYGCLVSAATDKTIKLWDLQTFQELCRLTDNYQHRPVDRLTSMSYDDGAGRLLTFGNRGRVWQVAPGSIQAIEAAKGEGGEEGAGDAARKASKKTAKKKAENIVAANETIADELAESGWTVVDIKKIAHDLETQFQGSGLDLKLDVLTGSRLEIKEENLDEIEKDKWVQLQESLELARDVGERCFWKAVTPHRCAMPLLFYGLT